MPDDLIDPRREAEDTLDAVTFSHGSNASEYAAYAQAYATLELAKQQARTADALELANLIQARALGAFDTAEEYKATRDKIRELAGLPKSAVA